MTKLEALTSAVRSLSWILAHYNDDDFEAEAAKLIDGMDREAQIELFTRLGKSDPVIADLAKLLGRPIGNAS